MSLWFQHVDLLHADGGLGFQKEFDYIQAATAEKKGDYMILMIMFNVQQHKEVGDIDEYNYFLAILLISDDCR